MAAPSLKALAESKTEGIQKATYFKVSPRKVEFEPCFNLREEGTELDAHIETIAQLMQEGYYFPPIDVMVIDGRIIARDGHCRTRAALKLLDRGIEYMLEARQLRGNDADAVYHMLGSDQGKRFSPLEQGRGFLRLINMGATVAEIAKRTGQHRSTVENGLALAEAPTTVQAMIGQGKIASTEALKVIRAEGNTKAAEVLQTAVAQAQAEGKAKVTAKDIPSTKPKLPAAAEMWGVLGLLADLDPSAPDPAKVADLIQAARRLRK